VKFQHSNGEARALLRLIDSGPAPVRRAKSGAAGHDAPLQHRKGTTKASTRLGKVIQTVIFSSGYTSDVFTMANGQWTAVALFSARELAGRHRLLRRAESTMLFMRRVQWRLSVSPQRFAGSTRGRLSPVLSPRPPF